LARALAGRVHSYSRPQMNQPKLHHYVSRLYLRNFVNGDGKFWVYDKQSDSVFAGSPDKVAAERHFYRLPGAMAHLGDPLAVETALSRLESEVAPVLARLVAQVRAGSAGDRMRASADDRVLLAEYIAAQYFRTLEMRELLLFQFAEIGIDSAMDEDEQKAILFAFLGGSGVIEEMAESLYQAIWVLAKNASGTPLVTSDNPVCIKTFDNRTWVKGIDPLTQGRYVVLPLAPDVVLYCKETSKWESLRKFDFAISPVTLDLGMVEHENAGQAFMATRFIYSVTPDFGALREFIPSIGTDRYAAEAVNPDTRAGLERAQRFAKARTAAKKRP
jgi:hypothetical protein